MLSDFWSLVHHLKPHFLGIVVEEPSPPVRRSDSYPSPSRVQGETKSLPTDQTP